MPVQCQWTVCATFSAPRAPFLALPLLSLHITRLWKAALMVGLAPVQVCNHPDLFEGRPIVSAFDAQPLDFQLPSLATQALQPRLWVDVSLAEGGIGLCAREVLPAWEVADVQVRTSTCCEGASGMLVSPKAWAAWKADGVPADRCWLP